MLHLDLAGKDLEQPRLRAARQATGQRPIAQIAVDKNHTLAACAINSAKLLAIVDLPSLGTLEVTPMILFSLIALAISAATLMERNPSANNDRGSSTTRLNSASVSDQVPLRHAVRLAHHRQRFVNGG